MEPGGSPGGMARGPRSLYLTTALARTGITAGAGEGLRGLAAGDDDSGAPDAEPAGAARQVHGEPGDLVQTCVSAAAGPVSLDL